jgi:hypothetical protein
MRRAAALPRVSIYSYNQEHYPMDENARKEEQKLSPDRLTKDQDLVLFPHI